MLNVQHQKTAAAIHHRFLLLGEITLDGQQHPGQSLAIPGNGGIVLSLQTGDAEKSR